MSQAMAADGARGSFTLRPRGCLRPKESLESRWPGKGRDSDQRESASGRARFPEQVLILVLSGPSGAGKTALLELLYERGLARVVPYTTRSPRRDEVEGVDFHFVSRSRFQSMIQSGDLVDWDFLFGNYYGYGRDLESSALAGEDLAIPVIARMALRLRSRLPSTFLVFVDGDDAALDRRIAQRGTPAEEERLRRDAREEEREHAAMFDARLAFDGPVTAHTADRLLQEVRRSEGRPSWSRDVFGGSAWTTPGTPD